MTFNRATVAALITYWENEGRHLEAAGGAGDEVTVEYATKARETATALRAAIGAAPDAQGYVTIECDRAYYLDVGRDKVLCDRLPSPVTLVVKLKNDVEQSPMMTHADEALATLEPPQPVDRTQRTLTDGSPVTEDHRELKENGQQKGYVVLSAEERAKGFVRPVRRSYKHLKCGGVTTMGHALAETYARDPYFYSGTFCCDCGAHYPVGEDGEFVWVDGGQKVGT